MLGPRVRRAALVAAAVLPFGSAAAAAATYPSPAHDFGPVAGAGPLYNAANAANPRPLLVILTTFTDLTTPSTLNESTVASRVFGPGFPNLAAYYSATSFGKMTFTPAPETCGTANDGVVTVNVGDSTTFLAKSDPDLNRTVLDAVNALGCVDFSKFDRNHDGNLTDDEIAFLQIDATPRNCGATRSITSGATYNGVTVDSNKAMSDSAAQTNILTLAHEVGHQTLDTRDLYGFGVGSFDLYGPTCGPPDTTMFEFSAWQKLHLGWITPTVVTRDGYYDVPRADTSPAAFLLYDPDRGTNDYFLVENREPTAGTYDQSATDSGLVIWRADDSQYTSGSDTVRPIEIMRPDGATNAGCSGGSCYGGSNGDAWDPSDPATPQRTMARPWRDGTASRVAVRAIGEAGGVVRAYFDVRGPGVLVDTYALQHAAPPDLTLGTAGAVTFPVMNTGESGDTFAFTATGLPAGWTASVDTQTLGAGVGSTATVDVTPPLTAAAGVYTLQATGTSATDSAVTTSSAFTVNVVRRPTSIVYDGDLTADYHDVAQLRAMLTDTLTGLPLSGTIDFALGTQTISSTTGAASIVVGQAPAAVPVSAAFAGDATYLPSSDSSHTFTITREETSLAYTGPTVVLAGSGGATLTARLVEDGANDDDSDPGSAAPDPAGQAVTFTIDGQSCTGSTDATGVAGCTIPTITGGSLGPQTITAAFAGDTFYTGSSATGNAVVFAFPQGGAFVLGDATVAAAGSSGRVTWWSSRWSALDRLTGSGAPAAFKGFAGTVATLPTGSPAEVCSGTWTARGGSSTPPPGEVPSYMGTIVATHVAKAPGSVVRGDYVKIVVVRTDPGYAPDAGSAGTGTIVATFCG